MKMFNISKVVRNSVSDSNRLFEKTNHLYENNLVTKYEHI